MPTYFRQPDPQWALDLFVQLLETPLFKADGSGQFSSGKFNLFLWAAQVLNHNPLRNLPVEILDNLVDASRTDWNLSESSWNFERNPLVMLVE